MIELYKPHIDDLWFREKMLSDEHTMSYNHVYGGTISFSKEYWTDWYDRWIRNHNGKYFYRYIKENDTFVGEVAYHFDKERQIFLTNVIIYAPYRKKGYGQRGLLLLCKKAKENGITALYDDIAIDNSSITLFLKCGFEEIQRTSEYVLVKKEL